ncbi:MAG: toxin HicA [Candidatus Micrarchaeota archaeon]|nr:toxin HicA [Candidatus Micrarchaeota archaeon]
MARMRPVKRTIVVDFLVSKGFASSGMRGSHEKFVHPDGRRTTVLNYRELWKKPIKWILDDIGATWNEFEDFINR